MSTQIYQCKEYKIYKVKDNYIIHNSNKEFYKGHTHISNFNYAKHLIYLCINKIIPEKFTDRDLESLIRLTNNNSYKNKLINLIEHIEVKNKYL